MVSQKEIDIAKGRTTEEEILHQEEIQRAAQLALDAQSACNLRAVLRSYSKVMDLLWKEAHREDIMDVSKPQRGSDWVHLHPISVLFATQVGHLTRVAVLADDACHWNECEAICQRLAAGEWVDSSEFPYEKEWQEGRAKARAKTLVMESGGVKFEIETDD